LCDEPGYLIMLCAAQLNTMILPTFSKPRCFT
jgi:hypothetical protein